MKARALLVVAIAGFSATLAFGQGQDPGVAGITIGSPSGGLSLINGQLTLDAGPASNQGTVGTFGFVDAGSINAALHTGDLDAGVGRIGTLFVNHIDGGSANITLGTFSGIDAGVGRFGETFVGHVDAGSIDTQLTTTLGLDAGNINSSGDVLVASGKYFGGDAPRDNGQTYVPASYTYANRVGGGTPFQINAAAGSMTFANGYVWTFGSPCAQSADCDGATTCNTQAGSICIPTLAASVVVSDSLVTATTHVKAWVISDDATAIMKNCLSGSGTFTCKTTANATNNTVLWFEIAN
jgi:hypothetical protein